MKIINLVLASVFLISFSAYPLSITDIHKEYLFGNYEKAVKIAKDLSRSGEVLYY